MNLYIQRLIPEQMYLDKKGVCEYSAEEFGRLYLKINQPYRDNIDPLRVLRIERAVCDLVGTRPDKIWLVSSKGEYLDDFLWSAVDTASLPDFESLEGTTEFYPNKIRVGPTKVCHTYVFTMIRKHYIGSEDVYDLLRKTETYAKECK